MPPDPEDQVVETTPPEEPGAATVAPVAPTAPAPDETGAPAAEAEAGAETAPPAPEPEQPKKDWKDSRIAELTAKLNKERAKKVEPPQGNGESQADFDARVEARAAELAAEQTQIAEWNRRCNETFAEGTSAFPDFKEKLAAAQSVVNREDPEEVRQYNDVLEAAMETGVAAQLLHELGQNPGEFKRLMGLSQTRRVMELATRAAGLRAAPTPSGAPKPIKPIGSSGAHYEEIKPDDAKRYGQLPKAEWFRRREAQARERGIQ